MTFFHALWIEPRLATPPLRNIIGRIGQLCESRYVPLILLILSILRAGILLLAYPPAQQSDSDLFLLYAERLTGYDIPLLDKITYPAYPFLLVVTYKWLGSAYWMIALQFLMGLCIAPLLYYALKPYSVILAAIIAFISIGDFQTAATFNFTGAEPLYIFLLALTFCVFLRQIAPGAANTRGSWRDSWTGILMVLLWLTRTIGRYLIWPYAIIYLVYTRSWKRTAVMLIGFGVSLVVYAVISTLAVGAVVGLQATDFAFARVMLHHPDWVNAENGPNTQLWLDVIKDCDPPTQFHRAYCLYERLGTWEATEAAIGATALETIRPNWQAYLLEVWNNTLYFLSSSAEVYNLGDILPSDAQCDYLDTRLNRIYPDMLKVNVDRTVVPILAYPPQSAEFDDAFVTYKDVMTRIITALCPTWEHHPQAKDFVDEVLRLNRIFARPNPHMWYGGVLLLTLIIPFARRYLGPVLITGGTMVALSISPAMLTVHTNPRYVIPINFMRIMLLSILVYILLRGAIYAIDGILKRRLELKNA